MKVDANFVPITMYISGSTRIQGLIILKPFHSELGQTVIAQTYNDVTSKCNWASLT
jgi:hypothetical protein